MTDLKLSAAIRLGSMLIPRQCRFKLFDWDEDGDPNIPTHACALGAARHAGYSHRDAAAFDTQTTACPACRLRTTIIGSVTHLNDTHYWTREQIADWIETQEQETTDGKEAGDDQRRTELAEVAKTAAC